MRELRVISAVDGATQPRSIWNQHRPGACACRATRRSTTIDPVRPLRIETVAYQLQVSIGGQSVASVRRSGAGADASALRAEDRERRGAAVRARRLARARARRTRQRHDGGAGRLRQARARTGVVPEPVRLIELRDRADAARAAARRRPDGGCSCSTGGATGSTR